MLAEMWCTVRKIPDLLVVAACFGSALCGQQVCGQCHPREAANYARTAMAQSSGTPSLQPGGRVTHPLSGSNVVIESDARGMVHTLTEGGLKAQYRVAYYIGAGIVGRSYLVRQGEYLLQSPVSYYTKANRWDLTPGYESEHQLDFDHQIVSGCLFCHAGSVALVGGSTNRYQEVPFTAISCERCHGPGEAHIQSPSRRNIINAASLEPRARDSVCEQCHLEGAVRILNPGKDWWDFQPGQELEQTFSVYLEKGASGLKAVSQPEQLAESRCARMSGGRLWCGTCHDPHGDAPTDRKQQVREICLSCHPKLTAQAHPTRDADCTGCHMPTRNATNVAHAAITDHRISKRLELELEDVDKGDGESVAAVAWREPAQAIRQRNLGLAGLSVAKDHGSLALARESVERLAAVLPEMTEDPEVLDVLGSVLLQEKQPHEASKLFARAAQEQPSNAVNVLDEAVAFQAVGNTAEAIRLFEHAIHLDPSLQRAYFELANLYRESGHDAAGDQVLRRYLKIFPESIKARRQLRSEAQPWRVLP